MAKLSLEEECNMYSLGGKEAQHITPQNLIQIMGWGLAVTVYTHTMYFVVSDVQFDLFAVWMKTACGWKRMKAKSAEMPHDGCQAAVAAAVPARSNAHTRQAATGTNV
jgi:hypothetical protein